MSNYFDFNDTTAAKDYQVIPDGTVAKVVLYIRSGGYNDERNGWTDGYATRGRERDSIYLNCELTVVAGEYEGRKFFHNIGLFSPKGEMWGNMGRSMIRAILNSANGLRDDDDSPQAQNKRRIRDFSALDGLEFVARIGLQKKQKEDDKERNELKAALDPSHADYAALMNQRSTAAPAASAGGQAYRAPANNASAVRPSWAR